MSTLRQIALGLALIASIAGLIWLQQQRIESAQTDRAEAQAQAKSAQQTIARRDGTIAQLNIALEQERTAQAGLRQQQAALQVQLRQRERTIKELEHENEELRGWARQPLPAAAQRLRQRPAITGAAAYYDWLSRSNAVHAERHGAPEQRPATER